MSELTSHASEYFSNITSSSSTAEAFEDIKNKSRERIKESDATLMENARTLMSHREFQLAISLLRSVLSRSPFFAPAIRRIGVCHRELGRLDHALKCFQILVKTEPTSENFILLADVFYVMERDQEAMKYYQTALMDVNVPMSALFNVYKNLGNIFVRGRDFETAEEYYNKAYTIDSQSDTLLVNYGTLEIQRENLEKALSYFREAIQTNGENDKAWVGLSLVHRHMGDFELSHANIERALDINSKNRTALKLLIEWGVCDFKFAQVIERLQEYLSLESEDTEMSFTLAKIFAHLNRLDDAQIEMQRVLALDSEIPGAQQLAKAIRNAKISEAKRP